MNSAQNKAIHANHPLGDGHATVASHKAAGDSIRHEFPHTPKKFLEAYDRSPKTPHRDRVMLDKGHEIGKKGGNTGRYERVAVRESGRNTERGLNHLA